MILSSVAESEGLMRTIDGIRTKINLSKGAGANLSPKFELATDDYVPSLYWHYRLYVYVDCWYKKGTRAGRKQRVERVERESWAWRLCWAAGAAAACVWCVLLSWRTTSSLLAPLEPRQRRGLAISIIVLFRENNKSLFLLDCCLSIIVEFCKETSKKIHCCMFIICCCADSHFAAFHPK